MRRYVTFIIALFIIAFGTSLSIRANLGVVADIVSALRAQSQAGQHMDHGHIRYLHAHLLYPVADIAAQKELSDYPTFADCRQFSVRFLYRCDDVDDRAVPVRQFGAGLWMRFIQLCIGGGTVCLRHCAGSEMRCADACG